MHHSVLTVPVCFSYGAFCCANVFAVVFSRYLTVTFRFRMISLGCFYQFYRISSNFQKVSHGFRMVCHMASRWFSMVCLWFPYGFLVVSVWIRHDFLMLPSQFPMIYFCFQKVFHGFPMVFLWSVMPSP